MNYRSRGGAVPLSELRQQLDSFFDELWNPYNHEPQTATATEKSWHPPCDVEEAKDHYLLTLEMAGVPRDQIKIEAHNNQLFISGEREQKTKRQEGAQWYSERNYGKFHRSFALPSEVNAGKIEAHYQDGVLRLYVPKAQAQSTEIKITDDSNKGFFGKFLKSEPKKDKEDLHLSKETNNGQRVA